MASLSKKQGLIIAILIAVIIACVGLFVMFREPEYEAKDYTTVGFANMRGYEGKVYRGIGGAWGEDIPVEASAFAMSDGKIYYGEQVTVGYSVNEERFAGIYVADMPDGSNARELVDDAYNVGYGQEKLIGDKIFYMTGYDDDYNIMYSYVDINTGEKGAIDSTHINNIYGYDGVNVYYTGFDVKKGNVAGRYNLTNGKDKILFTYEEGPAVGTLIGINLNGGKIYDVKKTKEAVNYDDRTAEYVIEVRDTKKGKVISTLPFVLSGAANYGFLFDGDTMYYSTADSICKKNLSDDSDAVKIADFTELEYWGLPHFAPGDGYIYYETLADFNPDDENNDFFYRVDINGGTPELLAAWYTN